MKLDVDEIVRLGGYKDFILRSDEPSLCNNGKFNLL